MSYTPRIAIQSIIALQDRLPESDKAGSYVAVSNIRINKIIDDATYIDQLIEKPDPMLSRLAIDKHVLDARKALRDFTLAAQTELDATYTRELDAITKASTEASGLIVDEFAAEYRTLYRPLGVDGQARFLQDALDSGNAAQAAAILNVAPALAGSKSQDVVDSYRAQFLQKTSSPGKVKALEQAKEITDGILAVAGNIGGGARSE
jgi:hypothetical protein